MKSLYYNPMEIPNQIHLVSKCFGIDVTYSPAEVQDKPVHLDELFNLAKCNSFDLVEVYFTPHNEGYTRKNKNAIKEYVNGWISLKGIRNGGGYLDDKCPY